MNWILKAAKQDDIKAETLVGLIMSSGAGATPHDLMVALSWLREAASHGNAQAQYRLGRLYETGKGVKDDKAEATRWYRLAAEQGHGGAEYAVGYMILAGDGGVAAEAARWYRRAADHGSPLAQCDLGAMYRNGYGVPEDPVAARELLRAGVGPVDATGDSDGLCEREFALSLVEQTPPDYRGALKWARKAADLGDARAQYFMGLLLDGVPGVTPDKAASLSWLRMNPTCSGAQ